MHRRPLAGEFEEPRRDLARPVALLVVLLRPVRKLTSVSRVMNQHRHAIEQASRRWHGGRRDDSARTRVKFDFHTVFGIMHWGHRPSGSSSSAGRGRVTSKAATTTVFPRPVRKSTSEAGVPDNSSRGHFSAVSKKRREFGFSHCLTPISSARMPPGSCVNWPPVGRSVTNSARRRGSKKCWPSQDWNSR